MQRNLPVSPSGQACQEGNVGHMHGGGTGGQKIMIVLKAKDFADLSAIEWPLTHVAGRGDTVTMLGVVHELQQCCPKLRFRTALGLMCHRVCPTMHDLVPIRKRLAEEQVFKTKENYRKILRNLQQPCSKRGVKLNLEIVPSGGQSLRQVAVKHAWARKVEWVILDRHLRKARHYFVKRLPCNLVLMTDSNQGSILKLGPGWRLQRGDCCSEACSTDEKSVSGLVFPNIEKDRNNSNNIISEDSSDYTGSGDSDLSSHGGDHHLAVQHRVSKEYSKELELELMRIREHLPPLIVERHEGETSSDDEPFHSTSNSPPWSCEVSSPEQQTRSSAATCTRVTIGGVLSLPLCSTCKHKVPDFGPPKKISLEEIMEATNNFSSSNHLMDCKFAKVYKGFLADGQAVSVKRLDVDSDTYPGDADFCSEIEILSLAHHVNVVTLVGFCIDDDERILVFEFACNEALSWHLSPLNPRKLPWSIRRKIALETARGLRYLHEECRAGSIVHGSVELDNVRLTHDYSPVMSNFGKARLRPHSDKAPVTMRKPLGYLAPEVRPSSSITTNSDVYSFGVLLLELINGGRATDPDVGPMSPGERSVLNSVRTKLDMRSGFTLVDPDLEGDYDDYELHYMVHAASLCIQTESSLRPSMSKVLSILEGDQLEEETEYQVCDGRSSCGQVLTGTHFDMISAGVMVF